MIVSGLRHDTGELGHFLDLVKAGGAEFPLRGMVTLPAKTGRCCSFCKS